MTEEEMAVDPSFTRQVDWSAATGITSIRNKPTFGTAALADSSAFATAAQGAIAATALQTQANADWSAVSGPGAILNKPTIPSVVSRSFNNAPGRTIVSVAAAANGWQIDATRDAYVSYSATINTASNLAGGSAGYVALEICATNSAVAANWIEISRTADGQSNGLIVGLALNQVGGGCITGIVPGGYYVRQRSVNTTGTPTYTANGQQEVKL